MTPQALKALKGSIKKWKAIVAGTGKDLGTDNCPLCEQFFEGEEDDCQGCPVRMKTKNVYCHGSPYDKWCIHHEDIHGIHGAHYQNHWHVDKTCKECARLAKAELNFLEHLLPKEKKKAERPKSKRK